VYAGENERIPQGTRLSFDYWTTRSTVRERSTLILAQSMAECGIEAKLQYIDASEFFADGPEGPVFGRRFDLAQFAWFTGVEPSCYLWWSGGIPGEDVAVFPFGWGGWNVSGYSNPEFDTACGIATQSVPGMPEYEENHMLAQAILAEDLPIIPLIQPLKIAVSRPDMCGLVVDSTQSTEFWNIEEFDYGDGCGNP